MKTLIKNFKEISKLDVQIAGGKGASLGEMTQAGIPVPPGFVVLSGAFEQFIIETDLNVEIEAILKTVDNQKMHTVENASEKIQLLILEAKMPEDIAKEIQENFKKLDAKFVAVRSSATAEDGAEAAWAGQLESYLNTTQKSLLKNVQGCWTSLFTPRAIFYRFEKKMHKQKISVAVVVQKMIQSEISGIAFSVHPVTEDCNQLIIEAGFGLGEAIVSGSITPDAYVVSKNPRKIEDINISQQSKGLFRKKDGGNFWQDIPEKEGKKQKLSKKQILKLSDLIIKIEDHYQFPVDIEWAYENKKFYIVQSRPITTLMGKKKLEDEKNEANTQLEYFKFKFPAYRYFMANRLISTFKYEDVYLWGEIFGEYSPEGMHRTCTNKKVLLEPGKKLFELLKNGDQKLEKELLAIVNEIIALGKELQKVILKDKLTGHVSDLNAFFPNYEKVFNKALAFGYPLDYAIDEYLKKDSSLSENLQSPYSSFLMEEEYELYEIFSKKYKKQELVKALERHLAKYAWIKSDYQGENVLTMDDLYVKEARLMEEKPKKTKSISGKVFAPKNLQEWISLLIYLRDVRKKVGMIGVVLLDRYLKQECQILKKDYLKARLLSVAEFEQYKNKKLPEYLDKRNEHMTSMGIEIISNEKWQTYPFNQEIAADKEKLLTGVVANKGNITGVARIIIGKHDFHKMQKGDVIVASMTRPEFMPILRKASAILTEQGGITCHAAIISRELGIPCIIGIENLTAILKDGDLVEVDANKGVVRIIKKAKGI